MSRLTFRNSDRGSRRRLGDLRRRSGIQGSSRNLPHRQWVGVLKRQSGQALPDPDKESFAPGSYLEVTRPACCPPPGSFRGRRMSWRRSLYGLA